MLKIILLLYISINCLMASNEKYSVETIDNEEFACFTEWMILKGVNNGNRFKPSDKNLQSKIISFDNNMHILKLKTTNYDSYFNFQIIFSLPNNAFGLKKGTKGIRYYYKDSIKKLYYDVYENGNIIVWLNDYPIIKDICTSLKLNIK